MYQNNLQGVCQHSIDADIFLFFAHFKISLLCLHAQKRARLWSTKPQAYMFFYDHDPHFLFCYYYNHFLLNHIGVRMGHCDEYWSSILFIKGNVGVNDDWRSWLMNQLGRIYIVWELAHSISIVFFTWTLVHKLISHRLYLAWYFL